jgi:hypothetical protein
LNDGIWVRGAGLRERGDERRARAGGFFALFLGAVRLDIGGARFFDVRGEDPAGPAG